MSLAYNDAVLRYFRAPAHAGNLAEKNRAATTAYVEEGGAGARILLTAAADSARLRAIRYAVFGCPHLIAAAELICERFEGQPVEVMADFDPRELIDILAVPVEKTGRILLLEDAVRALYAICSAKT